MRILEFTITEQEEGWSVEQFLKKRLQFGKKQISRLKFREDGLRLNGCQCRSSHVLKRGDFLCLCLDEQGKAGRPRETFQERLPAGNYSESEKLQKELPMILYEDEDLLAVYKPGDMPVHPSHGHYRDTLWNQIISLQKERTEWWTPRIIGRLDRATSGIVLLAKTTEAAAIMADQREKKLLRKKYFAEAEGIFKDKEGVIDFSLEKDPGYLNRMRICEKGLTARTHYRVLKEREGRSLLCLELEQGRTHQIRVHLSSVGHPLLGDVIYKEGAGEGNLHLHAGWLCFIQPFTGKKIEINAPLPKWLEGGITI